MRSGIWISISCFLALLDLTLSTLSGNIDSDKGPQDKSDPGGGPGGDSTVDFLTVLMIVIAGAIVGGMFIIIVFISCKLRGNRTEPMENESDTDSDREKTKDPETYSPSLAPIQDTSREICKPTNTPEDMQIEPPPHISSYRSELATSSELDYYITRGTTLKELTDEFEKNYSA
ncbi:hypothetical protein ACHWQZ_G007492 [Mnemiopsis leidyi]